mgnify:CR=1 FL=1|tara:strand:- start:2489 stop:3814 length:1326 start_codon:yes stop_codon:yes gene_type:complete
MSSTGGMGRGSDTRMYSPRSESSHMYSANEGEEKYNPVDPKYKEWEKEKKLREDDEKQEMRDKLKHIKVLGHHGKNGVGEPESPDEADTELDPRKDLQGELSRQTGPPGNRGHELDLATGAKTGTGSAMGSRVATGEPMDHAWSELLKRETPKTMEGRRKKEKRAEFRPSTGQFKKPPGGQSGGPGSTMRRFKARMRGIKSGRKTGLMKPHLAVEMSHRGIKTKQPMSKDPARYRAYMGQQEAKKILGGARTVWSPHARYAERSTRAGPTGGGQLTGLSPGQAGQMRQPSLRRMPRPRMTRMRQPRMPRSFNPMGMQPMGGMSAVPPLPQAPPPEDPSQIMMSEDVISHSDLMKMNYSDMAELRILLRRIARAKQQEAKESKKKAGTTSATEGAMPSHPAGIHGDSDDEDPDGPTENLETKANRLGLDPAGYLVSRRGHMG